MMKGADPNFWVVNNSWVTTELLQESAVDPIEEAIQLANDILFVAGAGNGDPTLRPHNNDVLPVFPASYDLENVISVTATDESDRLVEIFNFGSKSVDLAAPGIGVYTTDIDGGYASMSGTSFATPFVSGVAALLLSNPALPDDFTLSELRSSILNSVDTSDSGSLSSLAGKVVTSGRLNAFSAIIHDAYAPRATLTSDDTQRIRGQLTYDFTVKYLDDRGIDIASLGTTTFLCVALVFQKRLLRMLSHRFPSLRTD